MIMKMMRNLMRILLSTHDDKEIIMKDAFKAIKNWCIDGHYFEFGVYRGRSFILAYKNAEAIGRHSMQFYAFDSFQGLSKPSAAEGVDRFHEGQYACSKDEFLEIIEKSGVDIGRVHCVEGYFSESLTENLKKKLADKQAAVIWIDCDLFEPTLDALRFITPNLQNGTIIVFDDWFNYGADPLQGEYAAVRVWLKENPGFCLVDYKQVGVNKKSFIFQKLGGINDGISFT